MILGNMAVFSRSLHLGRFAFAAVFLLSFFVSGAWAACYKYTLQGSVTEYAANVWINSYYYGCRGPACTQTGYSSCPTPSCPSSVSCGTNMWCYNPTSILERNPNWNCSGTYGGSENFVCYYTHVCDTQCDGDSLACVNAGSSWVEDPSATCGKSCTSCDEQCQCEEQGMLWTGTECIEDTTVCADMRSDCAGLGGDFTGSVIVTGGDKCCSGVCDLCGSKSMNRIANLKKDECCSQLQAPPAENVFCSTPVQSGCGFTTSQFQDPSSGEWACQDPNLDQATMDRYVEQCSAEVSSSSEGSGPGSSSGGSSSEGGGASSAGENAGCEECPWLDSILDTLHSIHYTIDDIKTCMQVPGACPGFDFSVDFSEMPVFAFDTAFRKYLKPLMDSTLKVDSLQLKALLKLDTNQLKQLKIDSVSLKNDTLLRYKVDALGNVIDTSVHSQIDTTRKWFKRIADSIGVSTDSLVAHIDSIVRHIPDSVLDSIVKYQHYANDNFDSVLFGHGKGFSLVDSLIDSSVKYFKESNLKWNEYISMYGDSTQMIHEEIIDLPGRNAFAIGSALGYGDTASTNLRGDLNGIREAIENGFGSLDSGWGDGTSPSDTLGDGPYSGYDDGSDSVGNVYLTTLGGLLDSAINDTVFGTIFATGEDTVNWDSSARLPSVDSMKAHLDSSIVTQRSEVEDSLQAAFDTLKDEFMLLNYDSLILAPLGMRVPNSNTCPEHCFMFSIEGGEGSMAWMGDVGVLDFGLCKPLPGFSFDVLYLIRIIGRMFTAIFCIYIGLWFIAGRKQ